MPDLRPRVQSSPGWGAHSADVVEDQLFRHRLHQRGLFYMSVTLFALLYGT